MRFDRYHILVLAMGARWEVRLTSFTLPCAAHLLWLTQGLPNFPLQAESVPTHIQKFQKQFSTAQHILIVGGGAIGIEIAGEVKDKWPVRTLFSSFHTTH